MYKFTPRNDQGRWIRTQLTIIERDRPVDPISVLVGALITASVVATYGYAKENDWGGKISRWWGDLW